MSDQARDGNVASRLKLVTSLAPGGIAIAEPSGRPTRDGNRDYTLTTFKNLDDRKRRMTLEDLLTMRSGTDYHESGSDSPHSQLNRKSRGWTQFILDRPMISEPGFAAAYC